MQKTYTKLPKVIEDIHIGKESEIVKNPWSGAEVELPPIAVAVYDLIQGALYSIQILEQTALSGFDPNRQGNPKKLKHWVNVFDKARYWFMKNFPNEYMILLD
tara:strand:- start:2140 stop:2448 length:309 start_codon:yes stop_codon:yes gene_type:complete